MSTISREHKVSPQSIFFNIWSYRYLILQMTKREVIGRYRGSIMGLSWSFLNPLLMLIVYTFVFSVVFKSRWSGAGDESRTQFALILFVGMIIHGFFSEIVNKAPQIILGSTNYVKKVVFPLEILPVISLCGVLFHSLISLLVLTCCFFAFNGFLHWTIVFIPLVFLPLIIFCLGLGWILSSLGVFMRDVGQTTVIVTTIMMFLSPVFFPVTALPLKFQGWIMLNPLTFIIEQARDVFIWGRLPDWKGLMMYTLAAILVTWVGYVFFQRTRKGFADVL